MRKESVKKKIQHLISVEQYQMVWHMHNWNNTERKKRKWGRKNIWIDNDGEFCKIDKVIHPVITSIVPVYLP